MTGATALSFLFIFQAETNVIHVDKKLRERDLYEKNMYDVKELKFRGKFQVKIAERLKFGSTVVFIVEGSRKILSAKPALQLTK